jgi:hypothetical protein
VGQLFAGDKRPSTTGLTVSDYIIFFLCWSEASYHPDLHKYESPRSRRSPVLTESVGKMWARRSGASAGSRWHQQFGQPSPIGRTRLRRLHGKPFGKASLTCGGKCANSGSRRRSSTLRLGSNCPKGTSHERFRHTAPNQQGDGFPLRGGDRVPVNRGGIGRQISLPIQVVPDRGGAVLYRRPHSMIASRNASTSTPSMSGRG